MSKKTLVDHLVEVMTEFESEYIDLGDLDVLSRAYERFGGRVEHPLNRNVAVMKAVRRSDRFEFYGYLRAHDSIGRPVKLAMYKLKHN